MRRQFVTKLQWTTATFNIQLVSLNAKVLPGLFYWYWCRFRSLLFQFSPHFLGTYFNFSLIIFFSFLFLYYEGVPCSSMQTSFLPFTLMFIFPAFSIGLYSTDDKILFTVVTQPLTIRLFPKEHEQHVTFFFFNCLPYLLVMLSELILKIIDEKYQYMTLTLLFLLRLNHLICDIKTSLKFHPIVNTGLFSLKPLIYATYHIPRTSTCCSIWLAYLIDVTIINPFRVILHTLLHLESLGNTC